MSLATIDRPRPSYATARPLERPIPPHLTPVPPLPDERAASATTLAPAAAPPAIRAVPDGAEARGFALYVGLDEATAAAAGVDLGQLVTSLKKLAAELVPSIETHAAVALAPRGAGGRNVDVVRLALHDPSAVAKHRQQDPVAPAHRDEGVVVDLSRKRVLIDGEVAAVTFKEFELLQYLLLRVGTTIDRSELIAALWRSGDDDVPNERTIDVHVRRLRSKLGGYEDIVRTVRGVGYRFDRHPDVSIRHASAPSPDVI